MCFSRGDKTFVLLAMDNPLERNSLAQMIRQYNLEIKLHEASDGIEGFKRVTSQYKKGYMYRLILTDLDMPKCDGVTMIS